MNRRLTTYYIIGLSLVVGWFLLAHLPTRAKQRYVDEQVRQTQQHLAELRTIIQELPEFLAKRQELIDTRSNIEADLFPTDDLLGLFSRLEAQARKHSLTITEISPPVEELLELTRHTGSALDPNFLNLTLKLRGEYLDFGRYMAKLEEEPYFRGVNHCQIVPRDKNQVGLDYIVDVRVLLHTGGGRV